MVTAPHPCDLPELPEAAAGMLQGSGRSSQDAQKGPCIPHSSWDETLECCWRLPGVLCPPSEGPNRAEGKDSPNVLPWGHRRQGHCATSASIPKFHLGSEGSSSLRGLSPAPSVLGVPLKVAPGEGSSGGRLPLRLPPLPGAFHPEGFKALGKPHGRAARAKRDRGESETRHPPTPRGAGAVSDVRGAPGEARMKGAGGGRASAGLQAPAPALGPRLGPGFFLTYFPTLPWHRLCPARRGKESPGAKGGFTRGVPDLVPRHQIQPKAGRDQLPAQGDIPVPTIPNQPSWLRGWAL